mmetsp:Transcript_5857/g.11469  ORF Transcript_5857/g.11469 Transcript_5857/m.11469 type:complete len:87 (-) Transcript_5857:105-365(-)
MVIFFPFRFLDVRDNAETLDEKYRHFGLPISNVRLITSEGIRRKVAFDKIEDKELANVIIVYVRREMCAPTVGLSSPSLFEILFYE